jgi:hypothetical protein
MLSSTNGPSCRERSSFIVENSLGYVARHSNQMATKSACRTPASGAAKSALTIPTMTVFLEAIFLSLFVLVSQNRQAVKDRLQAGRSNECESV